MTRTMEDAAELVSIGQLARDAGVSSRTIRYYEELGILPEPRRSAGGTRKYPREYGDYLAATLALKELGFRLDELRPLARLAAGRPISAGQREAAARLIGVRIDELISQVVTLRMLHDSVGRPDAGKAVCAVLSGHGPGSPAASPGPASTGSGPGSPGAGAIEPGAGQDLPLC